MPIRKIGKCAERGNKIDNWYSVAASPKKENAVTKNINISDNCYQIK